MVVYIFMDGNVKIVSPENVYQGSNVTEITLLAPFPDETSVSVGFELPDGSKSEKQPMAYTQTIIDGQSVRAYVYKLPYAITQEAGNVKMSFIAKFTNGQQTSYMANFEVQESVLPEPPENPDQDTYDLLLQYYQDAKNSAIAAQDAAGNVITATYATKAELANKADTSALSAYAPLANPAFTGTATLGGQNIATVNQIPDISGLATKSELSGYLPVGGTAASASKLATAHSFSITGAVIGTAVSFDGTGDVAINATSATDATKIALSGSRGTLAGYENTSVTASALTVTQDSPDSQQVTAAVQITVNDGSANTAWVKKISIKNTGVSIALGSAWSWVGGSQPTVTAPSLLVLSWDNDCGLAILNTTG